MKNCRMKNSRSQLPFCQQQHNTANGAVVALLVTCLSFSHSPHRKTINVSTLFLPEHDADRPIIISCNKSECYCCCLKIAHTAEALFHSSAASGCPEAMINMRMNINFMIEVNKKWEKRLLITFHNWILSRSVRLFLYFDMKGFHIVDGWYDLSLLRCRRWWWRLKNSN